MLNKKTLFNMVYAVALVGAAMTCFGFLNEFLTVEQLYNVGVNNLTTFRGETFWAPFWFYLLSFLVSTAAVVILILRIVGILKCKPWIVNLCLGVACLILLILSFTFVFSRRYYSDYSEKWLLNYYAYMNYYTLRTGVMQFVGNMAVILTCHWIDAKRGRASVSDENTV